MPTWAAAFCVVLEYVQKNKEKDKETRRQRQGEKEEKTTTTGKELRRLLFFTSFCSPPPPPPPLHQRNVVEPNLSACARSGAIVWLYPNIG